MRTLRIYDVPKGLYEALRKRALNKKRSIGAEALSVLEENVATEAELRRRRDFFREALRLQRRKPRTGGAWLSTEEALRKDRKR